MHSAALLSSSLLALAPSVLGQAMYSKNSPVLQVDAKSYDKLIAKSNYTSIVEFYAPWYAENRILDFSLDFGLLTPGVR